MSRDWKPQQMSRCKPCLELDVDGEEANRRQIILGQTRAGGSDGDAGERGLDTDADGSDTPVAASGNERTTGRKHTSEAPRTDIDAMRVRGIVHTVCVKRQMVGCQRKVFKAG